MGERQRVRYRVQASATTNTYVYCHTAAHRALRQAEREEAGCFYFRMMAGAFAAFTVEAFLNHVGQRRMRHWEALERRLGPREKLLLLCQVAHWSIDESKRPYQILAKMLRLRDALAHGKTVTTVADVILSRQPRDADRWPEPQWKQLCSLALAKRMVADADAIVVDLNKQSCSSRDPFASPGHGSSGVSEIAEK